MTRACVFADDDRGIEGLPIRLVIALVVGVAALGIMMAMLGAGFTDFGGTEVTLEIEEGSELLTAGEESDVVVSVYTEDGDPVESGWVLLRSDGARLAESPLEAEVGSEAGPNQAVFAGVEPELRTDQDTGQLGFDIIPPSDSAYEDADSNPTVTVIQR